MTPQEFRRIRIGLGLSHRGLAHALGVTARHVRRYEVDRSKKSARDIPPATAEKMRRLQLEGYTYERFPGEHHKKGATTLN